MVIPATLLSVTHLSYALFIPTGNTAVSTLRPVPLQMRRVAAWASQKRVLLLAALLCMLHIFPHFAKMNTDTPE